VTDFFLAFDLEGELGLFVFEPVLEAVHLLEPGDPATLLRHLFEERLLPWPCARPFAARVPAVMVTNVFFSTARAL
jgi:hypothetical protein